MRDGSKSKDERMSTEKTEWVELQVTMPKAIRDTIHESHRVLGSKASGWAREILLQRLPDLVERAERRQVTIQALFSQGNTTGYEPATSRRKTGNAARAKKPVKGQGVKAKS